jgi:hypothetical protein
MRSCAGRAPWTRAVRTAACRPCRRRGRQGKARIAEPVLSFANSRCIDKCIKRVYAKLRSQCPSEGANTVAASLHRHRWEGAFGTTWRYNSGF